MIQRSLLLPAFLLVLLSALSGDSSKQPSPMPGRTEPGIYYQPLLDRWLHPLKGLSPILLAIRDVESDEGRDCSRGTAGELTCFQILPATARLEKCSPFWTTEEAEAARCAARVLARGRQLCRRWDGYGAARWYNRGRCMSWNSKPSGYEMDVVRARLKYL